MAGREPKLIPLFSGTGCGSYDVWVCNAAPFPLQSQRKKDGGAGDFEEN